MLVDQAPRFNGTCMPCSSLDESPSLRGEGGGAQKKRTPFSYIWLQEVRLKLQPVWWHRKRLTRPVESWCLIDEQPSALDESKVARGEPRRFLPLAFVRVVAKSSFKIATCALAPKMCDTSRRLCCQFSRVAFVLVRPCGCYFFRRPRRPSLKFFF